jgi:hypothetical protein
MRRYALKKTLREKNIVDSKEGQQSTSIRKGGKGGGGGGKVIRNTGFNP